MNDFIRCINNATAHIKEQQWALALCDLHLATEFLTGMELVRIHNNEVEGTEEEICQQCWDQLRDTSRYYAEKHAAAFPQ